MVEAKRHLSLEDLSITSSHGEIISQSPSVILFTGQYKAFWQEQLLGSRGISTSVQETEWNEDLLETNMGAVKRAVSKVEFSGQSLEIGSVAIATDVLTSTDGKKLHKPNWLTKADAQRELLDFFNKTRVVDVEVGSAIKGWSDNVGQEIGISSSTKHKVTVNPMSEAEIELYIYGLQGKDGSFPYHLQDAFDDITRKYGNSFNQTDLDYLTSGVTLEELNKVNNGILWPLPLIQDHITEIDGISHRDESFKEAKERLFWSLLGAPQDLAHIYEMHNDWNSAVSPEGSVYQGLENWVHVEKLKNGTYAIFKSVEVSDADEIASMVMSNFMFSTSYSYLDDATRAAYIAANNPEGVRQTSSDERNIAAIAVRMLDDKTYQPKDIEGYIVIRDGDHVKKQGEAAVCKRLHVSMNSAGTGLGTALLHFSEEIVAENFDILTVGASGSSSSFFSHIGFQPVMGVHENGTFASSGKVVPMVYMQKRVSR